MEDINFSTEKFYSKEKWRQRRANGVRGNQAQDIKILILEFLRMVNIVFGMSTSKLLLKVNLPSFTLKCLH